MVSSPVTTVDLILLGLFLLFALGGYRRGFVHEVLDLVGLGLAVALTFLIYETTVGLIARTTGIPESQVYLLAFGGVFFVALAILAIVATIVAWPIETALFRVGLNGLNSLSGILPALVKGVVIVGFGLRALSLAPIGGELIGMAADSPVAGWIADSSAATLPYAEGAFDRLAEQASRLAPPQAAGTTPTKKSDEKIELKIPRGVTTSPDPDAEAMMLRLINQERSLVGRPPLAADERLRDVARAHGEEMFRLSYFAHESPTTGTPFDRLRRAGIRYLAAGENLAYAPTVEAAHRGLMESPEHRRNILAPEFRRVGIGVVQSALWGRMFTQSFTS